jgi:hypothetical protein
LHSTGTVTEYEESPPPTIVGSNDIDMDIETDSVTRDILGTTTTGLQNSGTGSMSMAVKSLTSTEEDMHIKESSESPAIPNFKVDVDQLLTKNSVVIE